ncbi:MAG: amidohydrolase family protein [Acetobacteraceae bacterium]|nr:amidohydrolase family protein [Acetobacteraceae bacterium]
MRGNGGFAQGGGIRFCGCSMLPADAVRGGGGAPGAARAPVMVGGQRVRTIDVHAHCVFAAVEARLGADAAVPRANVRGTDESVIRLDQRLAAMDTQRVDMEVLSVNPYWYGKPVELAREMVRITNEEMAAFCAAHADRFAGFAALTLNEPRLAVEELEHAMRRQGLKGAAIGGNVAGVEFADPRFHPVWAKAEELGAVLFIHPQGTPQLRDRFAGNGWLANTIGNPLDTTIALAKLILEGTLDRFPGLKVLAAHGGGYLPSYGDRMDHACMVNPNECNPAIRLRKRPSEYLRDIWVDSLVFSPEAIRHLAAVMGPDRIVLGSDYPYPWQMAPVDHVLACDSLSDAEKVAVLSGTAERLLNIPR